MILGMKMQTIPLHGDQLAHMSSEKSQIFCDKNNTMKAREYSRFIKVYDWLTGKKKHEHITFPLKHQNWVIAWSIGLKKTWDQLDRDPSHIKSEKGAKIHIEKRKGKSQSQEHHLC